MEMIKLSLQPGAPAARRGQGRHCCNRQRGTAEGLRVPASAQAAAKKAQVPPTPFAAITGTAVREEGGPARLGGQAACKQHAGSTQAASRPAASLRTAALGRGRAARGTHFVEDHLEGAVEAHGVGALSLARSAAGQALAIQPLLRQVAHRLPPRHARPQRRRRALGLLGSAALGPMLRGAEPAPSRLPSLSPFTRRPPRPSSRRPSSLRPPPQPPCRGTAGREPRARRPSPRRRGLPPSPAPRGSRRRRASSFPLMIMSPPPPARPSL